MAASNITSSAGNKQALFEQGHEALDTTGSLPADETVYLRIQQLDQKYWSIRAELPEHVKAQSSYKGDLIQCGFFEIFSEPIHRHILEIVCLRISEQSQKLLRVREELIALKLRTLRFVALSFNRG